MIEFACAASLVACAAVAQAQIFPDLTLDLLTDVGSQPTAIRHAGDGSGRLFIALKSGQIRVYDTKTSTLDGTPFLATPGTDLETGGTALGLLGLAFHPDYATNGLFYVSYTTDTTSLVKRFADSAIVTPEDPVLLLLVPRTDPINNVGELQFGPDGYLYIASGDGDNADDNAQILTNLWGTILRIDVDSTTPGSGGSPSGVCGSNPTVEAPYGIPGDNPYIGFGGNCDEIWHYGVRDPAGMTFDRDTGDLFIADRGDPDPTEEVRKEEVSFQPAGVGNLNLGSPCREADEEVTGEGFGGCAGFSGYTDPIMFYDMVDNGCTSRVTGGYRYRGQYLPLNGFYIFGDQCHGNIWFATPSGGTWSFSQWQATSLEITAFGEDEEGEIYLADVGGEIYRITTPPCPSVSCSGLGSWRHATTPPIGP